jgi:phosphatidate cytidylyltransferase
MNLQSLLEGTFGALVLATATGQSLRMAVHSENGRATLRNANTRIIAWWVLCAVIAIAMAVGTGGVVVLFAAVSCIGIWEFLPGAERDRFFAPLAAVAIFQYWLVWTNSASLFAVLVPAGALLAYGLRALSKSAVLAIVVVGYSVSYIPALLRLDLGGTSGNLTLLFYYLLVVQSSDILQYLWGKLLGRRRIAPRISPNKTWEGFLGGVSTSTLLGTALYRATPFSPWQAAGVSATITIAGFLGGLMMSAVKRRRGIKDFGTLIAGHGGVLDRIDSLCFSAPLFFYLVRFMA